MQGSVVFVLLIEAGVYLKNLNGVIKPGVCRSTSLDACYHGHRSQVDTVAKATTPVEDIRVPTIRQRTKKTNVSPFNASWMGN